MALSGGTLYPTRSYARDLSIFTFRFKPNGTSTIDATAQVGCKGVSVTYGATGLYEINLGRKYPKLLSAHADLVKSDTHAGHCFVWSSNTVSTDGKLVLKHFANSAGTFSAAAIAAHADTHVAVTIVVQNTKQDS